jgi:branched-subunit amino acid ABC-type transport system permease component
VLPSILSTGFAIGAIYALIEVTYNVMFSASRVMSFTAGQVGMLGASPMRRCTLSKVGPFSPRCVRRRYP